MMKKIFSWLLIVAFLFQIIPCQSFAEETVNLVHRETITLANMKISAVDGTAFIDFSNSETNKLISHLGYLVKIRDSAGKVIQGFVGSAGTVETLGDELITGWTNVLFETLTTVGKDISQAVNSAGGNGSAYSNVALSNTYGLYKISRTYTLNSGNAPYLYTAETGGGGAYGSGNFTLNPLTSGDSYFTFATATKNCFYTGKGSSEATDFALTPVCKQVLTPSASGITIVSTKGGSTQSFAKMDSAFNYANASGYTVELWKVNNAVQVSTGSVPASESKMDTTTANAFVAPESATVPFDLSAYQDGRHLYWAQDSNGKVACGWISASAPGGETLGAEKVVNGGFDSDTTSWTPDRGTLASIAGGQSGNCLEITRVSGAEHGAIQSLAGLSAGAVYKVSWYVKSGSSGNENHRVYFDSTYIFSGGATTSSWVQETKYRTVSSSTPTIQLYKTTLTDGTMLYDTASVKQVTDCAATGALLLSTQGGSRGYMFKDAAFNPNLALTYRIYYVGAP